MYRNPRILKILQNVDYGGSEKLTMPIHSNKESTILKKKEDDCLLLTEVAENQQENFQNIKYDTPPELTIPEFTDIQPGSFILQEDCSLSLEKNQTEALHISGSPSNIIICNDGSLRLRSRSSSTGSVSILNDSVRISITRDVADHILEQEFMTDAQETSVNESTLCPSDEYLYPVTNQSSSASKSVGLDISVHGNAIDKRDNASNQDLQPSVSGIAIASTSADTINCENRTAEQDITTSVSKRQKKSCPQNWSVNKNKDQREKGQPYLGKKKIDNKWCFIEPKSEKKIKDRCNCKLSLKGNTKLQCDSIPEEERQECFKTFWKMTWKEKKVYVKMSSVCKPKQRERCTGISSRRENSVKLYLFDRKGNRYRVCKRMFLNSLSIGEWAIKKWIIRDDGTPKNIPKNNAKTKSHEQLRQFFDSLPKLESHYCRKDSSKLYLEPLWTSKLQLYKAYKDDFCPREKAEPLCITSFSNMFEELNLSLFRPKKDLCETCESFKTKNVTESDYRKHVDMKKEAREELSKDTASSNEVFTMDLQSVLLSPRSNVSALYYKTKLIVHNFTMYDVKRNKGYCYIWNECEGKLTSNEFSTIIVTALGMIINRQPLSDGQELILYSDGCTYQNRNVLLSNALLNFSMQNKITVIQKFLEKGHTQMECDSKHSVIERAIRHKKNNVPADYAYLAKIACKKSPYEVEYLYHHFFKNIENTLTFYKSIRPGKKTGDPTVTNLRALRYVPDGKIVYKLRHSSTVWEELPTRIKNKSFVPFDDIPQLYSARLKIKKDKYNDLQELKSTMEKDYHKFYDELPHF